MKKVLILMAPMVIAASSAQVNQVLVTNFSASLEPGTVTRLQAAFRLLHLPVALFAVALGVTALPALTRAITAAKGIIDRSASMVLQNAIELVLWCMVPCLIYYVINSEALIGFLFQTGRFGQTDVHLAGAALSIYAFALIAYGLNKVLQAFYFSIDRTSYPMKVSLFGVAVNLVFLNLFISWGIEGLAAAFSCSLSINSLLLIAGMRGHGIRMNGTRLARSLGALFGAGLLAYIAQWFAGDLMRQGIGSDAPVWLRSGAVLLGNGIILVVVMLVGASFYLQKSPINIVKMLRRS